MLLTQMADLFDSDGTNYTVFLRSYSCALNGLTEVEDIVQGLVGHAVIVGEVRDCNPAEVAEELLECLAYVGHPYGGPGPLTLELPEFSKLCRDILLEVTNAIDYSNAVKSIEFLGGHPAYPVFWQFAFLFLGSDNHRLLVGSSSD